MRDLMKQGRTNDGIELFFDNGDGDVISENSSALFGFYKFIQNLEDFARHV